MMMLKFASGVGLPNMDVSQDQRPPVLPALAKEAVGARATAREAAMAVTFPFLMSFSQIIEQDDFFISHQTQLKIVYIETNFAQ